MTEDDVLGLIEHEIKLAGSQKDYAAKVGVSPAFVSAVTRGITPPSEKLLKPLGLRRVTTYEIAEQPSDSAFDPTSGAVAAGGARLPAAARRGQPA